MTLNKFLDKEAMSFLEIDTLLEKINPSSHYGKRLLKHPKVYIKGDESCLIVHFKRLKEMETLLIDIEQERIENCLAELKNISYSLEKIDHQELPSVVDLFEIKKFLFFFKRFLDVLKNTRSVKELYQFRFESKIWEILDPRKTNQFFFSIDSDYAVELRKELEKYRDLEKAEMRKACSRLENHYDLSLRNRTEFLLERSDIRNHALKKSEDCIVISENAFSVHYKVVPSKADVDYGQKIERIKSEMANEEVRYRKELMDSLYMYTDVLREQMNAIGEFDRDLALLKFKAKYNACFPKIESDNRTLTIKDGVLYDVKMFCERKGFTYDPVSIKLINGVTVIVGANMGGKTTSLKTIGQLYIASAMGFPVTARAYESSLFNSINCVYRTREEEGLSGFAMEVKRVLPVFESSCHLNLIDEFGSATNPKEGDALASSMVKTLSEKEDITVFVTHFNGPLNYGKQSYQTGFLKHHDYQVLNEDNIYRFIDHRLERIVGNHIPQAAIEISKALGLPEKVIKQAKELANNEV